MPRRSLPSTNRFALVRAYFTITQKELAACLGISEPLLNHLEAGRSTPTREVLDRLAPWLAQLREGPADEPLPPAPPPGLLGPSPPEKRRAACLHAAHNLRWQLRQLPEKARQAARWAQALPALQAALPPLAPLPPGASLADRREAIRLSYVRGWLATQATALDPETLTQWHLLHLRATALEAEATALAALLG